MTPQERQILTTYLDRIRQTQVDGKDLEADALIQQLVYAQPDATYILAQTALMQDFSLRQARAQIDSLQAQLRDAQSSAQPKSGGGFFANLFGGNPQARPNPGPWGQSPSGGYAPPPNYQQAPYSQPGYGQPAGTGFFHNAAQTALGVAGGALLFEGIESIFSPHRGFGGFGGMGGFGMGGFGGGPWGGGGEEIVNETVTNNYYDDPIGQQGQNADFSQGGDINSGNYDSGNFDSGNFDGGNFDPGNSDDGGGWV